jgi:hypothetical protein
MDDIPGATRERLATAPARFATVRISVLDATGATTKLTLALTLGR